MQREEGEDGSRQMAETAYPIEEATQYDKKRFTDAAGKAIHRFEMDCVKWGLEAASKTDLLIEVGCGTGRLLVELLEEGYKVHGLDASEHMLAQLRGKLDGIGQETELFVAEGAKTGRPDNHYEMVYSIRVLNQLESPEYALNTVKELVRIAKPGGHVLVEFVNDYRPRWGAAAKGKSVRANVTRLRPWQVAKAGKEAGAEILGFKGCFFTSMQSYKRVPAFLVPLVTMVDRTLSALMPRLCARTYVLLKKRDTA